MDNLSEHFINEPKYTYEELKRWRDEWLQTYEGQLEKTPEEFQNVPPGPQAGPSFLPDIPGYFTKPPGPNFPSTTTAPTTTAPPPEQITYAPTPFTPTAPAQTNVISVIEEPVTVPTPEPKPTQIPIPDTENIPIPSPTPENVPIPTPIPTPETIPTPENVPIPTPITNTEIAAIVNATAFNQRVAVINNTIAVENITNTALALYKAFEFFQEITKLNIEGRKEEADDVWDSRREFLDRIGILRNFETPSDGLQFAISTYNNLKEEALAITLPNYYDEDQTVPNSGIMPFENLCPVDPNTSVFSWFKQAPTFNQPLPISRDVVSDIIGNLANVKDRTSTAINFFEGTPFCRVPTTFNPSPPTPSPDSVALPTASTEVIIGERNKAIAMNDQDALKQIATALPRPSTVVPPDVTGPNPIQLEDQGTLVNKEADSTNLVPIGGPAPENEVDKQLIVNDFLRKLASDLQGFMNESISEGSKYGYMLIEYLANKGVLAAEIAKDLFNSGKDLSTELLEIAYIGASSAIDTYNKLNALSRPKKKWKPKTEFYNIGRPKIPSIPDFSKGPGRPKDNKWKQTTSVSNNLADLIEIGRLGAESAMATYDLIRDQLTNTSFFNSSIEDELADPLFLNGLKDVAVTGLTIVNNVIDETNKTLNAVGPDVKLTAKKIVDIGLIGLNSTSEALSYSGEFAQDLAGFIGYVAANASLYSLEQLSKTANITSGTAKTLAAAGLIGAEAAMYALQQATELGFFLGEFAFDVAAIAGANAAQAASYVITQANITKNTTDEVFNTLIDMGKLGFNISENAIKNLPKRLDRTNRTNTRPFVNGTAVLNTLKNQIQSSNITVEKFGEVAKRIGETGVYGAEVFLGIIKKIADEGYEVGSKVKNITYEGTISAQNIFKNISVDLSSLKFLQDYNPINSTLVSNLVNQTSPEVKDVAKYLFTVTDFKTELNNLLEKLPNITLPNFENIKKFFEVPQQASPYLIGYDGLDESAIADLKQKQIAELEIIEAMDNFLNSEIEQPVNFDYTVLNPDTLDPETDYNLEDPNYMKKMQSVIDMKKQIIGRPLNEPENQAMFAEISKTIEPPRIKANRFDKPITTNDLSYAQLSTIARNYANIIYGNILKRGKVISTDLIDMAVAIETFKGIKQEIYGSDSVVVKTYKQQVGEILGKLTKSIKEYRGDVPKQFEIANRVYIEKTLDQIRGGDPSKEDIISLPNQIKNIRRTYDIWKRIVDIKGNVPPPQDINVPTTTPINTVNLVELAKQTKTTQETTPPTVTPAVGKAVQPVAQEGGNTGVTYATMGQKVTKMLQDVEEKAKVFAGPSGGWPYNSGFQATTTNVPPSFKVVAPKVTTATTTIAPFTNEPVTQLIPPDVIQDLDRWASTTTESPGLDFSDITPSNNLYDWADNYIAALENVNDAVKAKASKPTSTDVVSSKSWLADYKLFKWAQHVISIPDQVAAKAQRLMYEPSVYDAIEMAVAYGGRGSLGTNGVNLGNNLLLLKSLGEYLTSGKLSPQTEQYLIANYDSLKDMLAKATLASENAILTGQPVPDWVKKYDKLLTSLTGYTALKESGKGAYNTYVIYSVLKVASETLASLYQYSGLWMFMPFSQNLIESYYERDMTAIDKMILIVDRVARGLIDVTTNTIPALIADLTFGTQNVPKKIEATTQKPVTKGSGKLYNKKAGKEEESTRNGINAMVDSKGKEKTWEEYSTKYSGKTYKASVKTPNNSLINMHIRIPNEQELAKWMEYSNVFSLIGSLIDQNSNPNALKNLKIELDQIALNLTTGANINTAYKINNKLDYVGRILGTMSYVIKKLQYVDNGQSEATIHMIDTMYQEFLGRVQEFLATHYNTEYNGTLKSIVGAGLGDISQREKNMKIFKEETVKVSKMPPWKKLNPVTVANDYIMMNEKKNVGLGMRKNLINIKEEPVQGCRMCNSWSNLMVHNKNHDDVTCSKCFEGRGKMTSKRYTHRTANIIPINKSAAHAPMLKQWQNNNILKLLKQSNPNGELAQSNFDKFNSNNANKEKILRWANRNFISVDKMNGKQLSKYLPTLISANELSPESLRRRGRVNLNNMINQYLRTQKPNSNKNEAINFDNSANFEQQLRNPSNSVFKALGLYQV